jgi:DNA-binding NarL/FixJ family response regulator
MKKKIRIVLAEDHDVMRQALSSLLASSEEFAVTGEACNGRELLARIETSAPDVVVMDINMPELNGIEATRKLHAHHPHIKIIGLSVHTKGRMVSEMLKAGANGYVPKTCAVAELLTAIRTVMNGKVYVSPDVLGEVMEVRLNGSSDKETSVFTKLTEREREVLQLLAEGFATKEIASKLCLSVPTIHTHRQHLMQKTGARSIADLVRYAIREGIISTDM